MPKIITAHTGEPHINSDDVSALQQAIIGSNDYLITDNPDEFKATLTDLSTVQLSAGEVVVQGTHIRILSTDKVTIEGGQTGLNRIDIIAICYSKSEEGIESAELKVIKGEASEMPNAPVVSQSDIRNNGMYHEMPLFTVSVEGLSVVSVDRVCATVQSLIADYNAILQNIEDISGLKQSINDLNSMKTTVNDHSESIAKITTNNLLWSGGYHMDETKSIALAQSVSSQSTGIVLVFSTYLNGTNQNNNFHSFLVPKWLAGKHDGVGHRFNMMGGLMEHFCTKYLYVSDKRITGHKDNAKSGEGVIPYENGYFVLRYVIGV